MQVGPVTDAGLVEKCLKKDLTDSQCDDDEDCRPYGDQAVCYSEVGEREREKEREKDRKILKYCRTFWSRS